MNRSPIIVDVHRAASLFGRVWRGARACLLLVLVFFVGGFIFEYLQPDYARAITDVAFLALQLLAAALALWLIPVVGDLAGRRLGLTAVLFAIVAVGTAYWLTAVITNPARTAEYDAHYVPTDDQGRVIAAPHPAWAGLFVLVGFLVPVVWMTAWAAVAAFRVSVLPLPGLGITARQLQASLKGPLRAPKAFPRAYLTAPALAYVGLSALLIALPFLYAPRQSVFTPPRIEIGTAPLVVVWYVFLYFKQRAVVLVPAWLLAWAAFRFARKAARSALDVILDPNDPPPVVLLRSFRDDGRVVSGTVLWRRVLPFLKRRLEEVAADTFEPLAPFVAIAEPGVHLQRLGALRMRLTETGDDWQGDVRALLPKSQIITWIAGITHWAVWELELIVQQGLTNRLLVLVPPVSPADESQRWQVLLRCFENTRWLEPLSSLDRKSVRALTFDDDGTVTAFVSERRRERDFALCIRLGALRLLRRTSPSADGTLG